MLTEIISKVFAFFARDISLVLWDVADIGLVALVLYYALSLIKGTRAMQMGAGLVVVFIIYEAAKRFGLVTLYAMLDTLLTSIVLIVVVVFQQDLRRALMRFGRRPLFAPARTALEAQVIEEVVRAATSLAQKRIGGLVVFERDAVLDEFVEVGTILDAAVSKELLYSIFIPSYENPMHDGAVIIRDGRVYQAGAFLPLSASTKLDKTLGTRHRAAIGLSEETDAAVVVISEERGSVSLCFDGNMVRSLDAASLRTALLGLLTHPVRSRPSRTSAAGSVASPPTQSARQTPQPSEVTKSDPPKAGEAN